MKNKLRLLFIMIAVAVVVPLTGCWDRREINDVAFILTTAYDLEPDGNFRVTVQIPLAGQLGGAKGGGGGSGGDKTYYIDSDTGRTIREASAKVQARSSRRLFSAHRRVVIIGEDLARTHGIRDLFEAISRFTENRITSYMIVSKGKAADLLNTDPPLERFSGEAIREMAKAQGRAVINIKNVAQELNTPYSDPVILYLGKKETEGGSDKKTEIQLLGYAHFKQDKMVDTFEKDKANALNLLRKHSRPYDIVIPFGQKHISLEMTDARTTIRPVFKAKNNVTFQIKVWSKMAVMENLSGSDLTDPVIFRQVRDKASESLRQTLLETLKQIQKYKTDPIDLGKHIWRSHPGKWQSTYRHDWRDRMDKADFDLQVQTDIIQIGYISSNIAEVTRE
ncbi:Ger(x)C family spore germination protein [Cohnella pontilimi]|nr:Ger(x)C family spore germination protein [Cohnella pontilimi]